MPAPVIVAITGASGAIYGIRLLEVLRNINVPAHLILTEVARRTIEIETDYGVNDVKALAAEVHSNKDQAACISSGSFRTQGMIVAPCSMKTLSGVANSFADNLVIRSADVCLKERRPVVLMLRETPFHTGHIDLMRRASDAGAIVYPPMPAFYTRPSSIDEIVKQGVGRALDLLGIDHDEIDRWVGPPTPTTSD